MSNKVIDIDKGWDDLINRMEEDLYGKQEFRIGVFRETPLELIKAYANEFGTSSAAAFKVPPRKWLSSFFDENHQLLTDIFFEAVEEFVSGSKSYEDATEEAAKEVINLAYSYYSEDPLSPKLSRKWLKEKTGPHQMVNEGSMLQALTLQISRTDGSDFKPDSPTPPTPPPPNPEPQPRPDPQPKPPPSMGGRPRGVGFMRSMRKLYMALTGPQLYEGFGQRKRAEAKSRMSTTRNNLPGQTSMPSADPGRSELFNRGRGHYPSTNRVN